MPLLVKSPAAEVSPKPVRLGRIDNKRVETEKQTVSRLSSHDSKVICCAVRSD
jgi:hypothetical protein